MILITINRESSGFDIIKHREDNKIEDDQCNDKGVNHIFNPSGNNIHCIRNNDIGEPNKCSCKSG